jgi:hypothetical protein
MGSDGAVELDLPMRMGFLPDAGQPFATEMFPDALSGSGLARP